MQPSMNPNPLSPPNTGSTLRSRLFLYAIGLSIGCLMTGALISARSKAVQAERARVQAQAAETSAAAAATPATPNLAPSAPQAAPR